jgi:hypothetical protein
MHTHTRLLATLSVIALPLFFSAHAADELDVNLGISAGYNQYTEPDIMQEQGPEVGFHARSTAPSKFGGLQLEGDVLLGYQRYTSEKTGSLNGVRNLETRWRVLTPLFGSPSAESGFSAGLGVHTLWNDLRGVTSTNHGGYRRYATQLWVPFRWASGGMWEIDAGTMLYGRHTSKLSDANARNGDVTNTQHRGQYAQVSMNLKQSSGYTLTPFVRYTHLADSNVELNQEYDAQQNKVITAGRYEPASQRWQIGVVWEFR